MTCLDLWLRILCAWFLSLVSLLLNINMSFVNLLMSTCHLLITTEYAVTIYWSCSYRVLLSVTFNFSVFHQYSSFVISTQSSKLQAHRQGDPLGGQYLIIMGSIHTCRWAQLVNNTMKQFTVVTQTVDFATEVGEHIDIGHSEAHDTCRILGHPALKAWPLPWLFCRLRMWNMIYYMKLHF